MRNKTLLLNNFHDTNIYVYCRLSIISFNTALMNRFHMQSISLNDRRSISSVDIRKAEEDGTGFLRSYFLLFSLHLNITCFSLLTLFSSGYLQLTMFFLFSYDMIHNYLLPCLRRTTSMVSLARMSSTLRHVGSTAFRSAFFSFSP